jgi:hypothetical protein
MAPMPGWSLNVTWFTEEGFPGIGLLTVHQFSGDGMFRKACQADMDLRAKLLSLALIDPREIRLENQPMSVPPIKRYCYQDANNRLREGGLGLLWTYTAGVQKQTWD